MPAANAPSTAPIAVLGKLSPFLRPYRRRLVAATVALVVSSLTVLLLGQGLRHIVDQGLQQRDATLLNQAVLGFIVRAAVFSRVIGLSPAYFETTKTGEVLSRLTTDTELLQTVIGSSLSMALRNMLTLAGALVMLAVTSLKLTLLVLVVVPAVVIPIVLFGRRVRKLSRKSQDRVADISAFAEETINAIRTTQAYTHEPIDRKNFTAIVDETFNAARSRIKTRALLTAIVIMLTFSAVAVVLWVGGYDVIAGRMTGGELSAFVFYDI